jgi:hypothetical protein
MEAFDFGAAVSVSFALGYFSAFVCAYLIGRQRKG